MSAIWLPTARGMVDSRVWRLSQAAREYDERLSVGRNEKNGNWTVYIARERGKDPYPVMNLGPHVEMLPTPDELKVKLFNGDTVRHGTKILEDIDRNNDAIQDEYARKADEGIEALAEAQVWAHRRLSNNRNKVIKVFPGEKRADRVTPEWK